MHHSQWSYNKTATPQRQENPDFSRETEPFDSYVWVSTTTLLCSIFLPVLVKAIPCIGKDLGINVYYCICITHGGVTTRRLHLEDERIPTFRGKPSHSIRTFGCQPNPALAGAVYPVLCVR